MKVKFIVLLCVISINSFAIGIERKPSSIKSFDGFPIESVIALPPGYEKADVKNLIVLVHGSGAADLNEDLSDVTEPKGTKNLFFRDLSDAFIKKGFATIRYNKRSYEFKKRLEVDKSFSNSIEFKQYSEHPLEYYIKDCTFFVDYAKKEFPNANILILGHSEGTGVALNVARIRKFVKGVALIGFGNERMATLLFEQTVYRQVKQFADLDKDSDGYLTLDEVKGTDLVSLSIKLQMPVLDLDGDKKLSLDEYKAGNYSNLILREEFYNRNYMVDEARLPRPSSIIKDAQFKILFLQGEYDNQTPSYFAKSIQLSNNLVWKKKNLKFVFFEKAGHALDPRSSLSDLGYKVLPEQTLSKISTEISDFLN